MENVKSRQQESIKKILSVVVKDTSVRSVFLKGSIARGESDEFSDVDLYCIIKEDEMKEFLNRRINYLEQYKPLIYWSEANFVGPQIVGVFENGLHFDLYAITYKSLQKTDEIKVLYDPENLLIDYKSAKSDISYKEIAEYFNEFSFVLLEFEAAYCRNDLLWASRLASHLFGDLSMILSYIYDKEKSFVGLKRLHKNLDEGLYNRLLESNNLIGPAYLPSGVVKLSEIASDLLNTLPKEVCSEININFFNFMFDKIKSL